MIAFFWHHCVLFLYSSLYDFEKFNVEEAGCVCMPACLPVCLSFRRQPYLRNQ